MIGLFISLYQEVYIWEHTFYISSLPSDKTINYKKKLNDRFGTTNLGLGIKLKQIEIKSAIIYCHEMF